MRQRLKILWGNEFVQGGFFLTISSFIANFFNYFFHFFAARILGPSGYGEIVALFSYLSLISIPMAIFSMIIIQKISAKEADQSLYALSLEKYFWYLIKQYSPLIFIALVIIPIMPRITNLSPTVAYLVLPMIFSGLIVSFYNSVLQGLRLFFLYSLFSIIGIFFKLVSIGLPAIGIDGIASVVAFQFLTSLVMLFVLMSVVTKKIKSSNIQALHKINNQSRKLFSILKNRQFIITSLSIISVVVFNNLDINFAKKFFSATDAGIYSSWSLLAKIILYVVSPVIQVCFVFFSRSSRKKLHEKILLISCAVLLFVGLASFIGYQTFGKLFISLLFGNRFQPVFPYLMLASIFGTFYTAINFLNNYFLAKKSLASIVLFLSIPFYIVFLFIIPKQLINIIQLNIIFSISVTVLYFSAFFLKRLTLKTL